MNREFLTRVEQNLKEGFSKLDNLEIRSLPESIFLSGYFQLFNGEITDAQEVHKLKMQWLQISGTALAPVNLIDINGNVVAQVPPVGLREGLTLKTNRQSNVNNAIALANKQAAINPRQGNTTLVGGITASLFNRESEIRNKYAVKWRELLDRYSKDKPAAVSENKPQATEDDWLSFDE